MLKAIFIKLNFICIGENFDAHVVLHPGGHLSRLHNLQHHAVTSQHLLRQQV